MSQENVSPEVVLKIARLACIKLSEDKVPSLAQEMEHILKWVSELNKINTYDVSPLANPIQSLVSSTPTRMDIVTDGGYVKEILSNAPEVALDMFVVPKVVE